METEWESYKPEWEPFATHRYHGRRFEEVSIPLEILPDLAAYGDLIERVLLAAAANEDMPREFPPAFAKRFNRIGSRLLEDEYVELISAYSGHRSTRSQ